MQTKTKLQHYTDFLQESMSKLHESEKWLPFLQTASRLYKYKFRDQVMIHAQRPTATACADYDLWRRTDLVDRQVKAGSRGIALLDDSGQRTNLRYVFDYADTEARSKKKLVLWQITEQNEDVVKTMLSQRYSTEYDKSTDLAMTLLDTAKSLANRFGGDYANELIDYTEDTFLEELDDYNVWVQFSELLENSIAYTLLARCGYDASAYFDENSFRYLHNFNGAGAIMVLGKAVSELSEQALRDIERTVKIFERSKQIERNNAKNIDGNTTERNGNDLHSGREHGGILAEPNLATGTGNRILRQGEEEISASPETHEVRANANERHSEQSLDGNGEIGTEQGDPNSAGTGSCISLVDV